MDNGKPTAEVVANFSRYLDAYKEARHELSHADTMRNLTGLGVYHTDPRELAAMDSLSLARESYDSIRTALVAAWEKLSQSQRDTIFAQLRSHDQKLINELTQQDTAIQNK